MDTNNHNYMLGLLKNAYDSDMADFNRQLNRAAADRDARAILEIQADMRDRTNQYNADVALENSYYNSIRYC